MFDIRRTGTSNRKPRAAKCVRVKLTDRILEWMNKPENAASRHYAREVAGAVSCSVGSAAQGLFYLFCHGRVTKTATRAGPSVYGLTEKGRAP